MIHELQPAAFERVRPLFESLRFHLASAAVVDGNSPGLVLVDEPARARSAFMLSPEGSYLAGDPDNDDFNRALNEAVVTRRALGKDVGVLFFVVHPEGWRDRLPDIVAPHTPAAEQRRHYVCRTVRYDWRSHLREGYTVRRIDRSLLDNPEIVVPDHVTGWMVNNWGSIDRFLEGGFAFAAMTGDELVSWSLTDCVSGDRCEIGIRTAPAHRRRGLAAATAAAAVEYALLGDFSMVGWHCPETNLGSIGTAEKVGFQKERDYVAYYAFLDEEL
ncbi:MAG: GNAT family N-acetyltransferase [Chloroflexota bacterium]|nr:GNAT family N-acetyltransferase [Chloroflexota bacterium]